VLKQGGAE
jgi:hypothetical protein